MVFAEPEWHRHYLCPVEDINLDVCLDFGGQSFTWIRLTQDEWLNCFESLPICITRDNGKIYFKTQCTSEEVIQRIRVSLRDYFRLDDDLPSYYKIWSSDKHFAKLSQGYPAIRLLRQDPVETLFAFICSQNNAIPRITKLVQHLKNHYGSPVGSYAGTPVYQFPPVGKLAAEGVEADLRKAGFGYRAKYIQGAARHLLDSQLNLHDLRTEPYESVHERLIELPGIGPKVADCIALMSLDQLGAVPVDTHIWQIACKQYRFPGLLQIKASMTKGIYKLIGDSFRSLFGPKAGWAHLVLFAAQSRSSKSK